MADEQATNMPNRPESKLTTVRRFFVGYTTADGYDGRKLTRGQKSAISRKYNELKKFQSFFMTHPGDRWVRVKTSRPEAVAAIESLGPQGVTYPKGMKSWRVVQVPPDVAGVGVDRSGRAFMRVGEGDGTDKRRAKFADLRVYFESFDPVLMATDPVAVAREMLRRHPNATALGIRTGAYSWVYDMGGQLATLAMNMDVMGPEAGREATLGQLQDIMTRLAYRYGAPIALQDSRGRPMPTAADDRKENNGQPYEIRPNKPNTHHYADWLTGMVAIYAPPLTPDLVAQFNDYKRQLRMERNAKRARRYRSRKAKR